MVRYQSQAVLSRPRSTGPLVLEGLTLDSTFYAAKPRDAKGRFTLTKGRVALAPLSPVDAATPEEAATVSMVDARETWNGPHSPDLPE
ncbi:hypothetical protein BH20CHL7_BH20CHL7_06470 [soil metagenome]